MLENVYTSLTMPYTWWLKVVIIGLRRFAQLASMGTNLETSVFRWRREIYAKI